MVNGRQEWRSRPSSDRVLISIEIHSCSSFVPYCDQTTKVFMRALRPALSSVTWVTIEKLTQQLLWLVLFSILAPILGPRAYGQFSIAMVFIGFCELVLGDGMIEVLVTLVEFERPHVATTNLLAGLVAAGLGLLLTGLAPAVGALFQDDDIRRLIWALAPLPLLSFLSAAPIATLRRDMQFQRLALRSTASLALGGAAGIGLAFAGAGVWALVVQAVVQRVAEVTFAWASVPLRFQLAWSRTHFDEMWSIGVNVFSARVMMFASGQTPRLVLGYILGPVEVGLFTLASRFLDIVMFTMVFPRIAVTRIEMRKLPSGSPEFTQMFGAMVRDVALVAAPLLLGAATLMPELYQIWLDPRWLPGVVPAQLLLLSGPPLALVYCFDAAFLAARLPVMYRLTSTIEAATTTVTMLIAAPFGLEAACLALLLRSWAALPLYVVWLRRNVRIPAATYLRLPLRLLAGAVLMAAALQLPWWRPPEIDQKLAFIGLILLGALCYGSFCYFFAQRELRAFLTEFVARRP
jgi:O-antigen/teichoic acid export membrane protein